MSVASANGQLLYYELHGEGEPLLCVMGHGRDVSGWARQLPVWRRHHRTIVFDNRDAGRSSYTDAKYALSDLAADTITLADALALERFTSSGSRWAAAAGCASVRARKPPRAPAGPRRRWH